MVPAGDLEGERPHQMVIGHCDRCGTVVEPRLSVQWFLRMEPLAKRALASVREGRTRIIPEHDTRAQPFSRSTCLIKADRLSIANFVLALAFVIIAITQVVGLAT